MRVSRTAVPRSPIPPTRTGRSYWADGPGNVAANRTPSAPSAHNNHNTNISGRYTYTLQTHMYTYTYRHTYYRCRFNATADMKKNMLVCCDMKPTLRSHTAVGIAQLALPRSLKMKSARFEKASEEIGVPLGKKSERYCSTAHRQTDRHDLFRFRASVYPW